MKIITRKWCAATAADRWKQQYFRQGERKYGDDKKEIYEKLKALGTSPNYKDVDEAIGNTSWTEVRCHECNKSVSKVIQLGQKPDYESATACICKPCLLKAMEEIK